MNRRKLLPALLDFYGTPAGKKVAAALVSLALALVGVTTAIFVIPNPSGGPPLATITVGGPHGTPTTEIKVPEAMVDQTKAAVQDKNLKTENPPGVTPKELDAIRSQQDALAASDQLPIVAPDAAPTQRGCITNLVGNYSSRRGVKPRVIFLHWTGSRNSFGWADVNGIVSYFDRPSSQVSSHFVVDAEGNCKYIVRTTDKAWTEAAANSIGIAIEQINPSTDATYAGVAGKARDAQIISDQAALFAIPIQRAVLRNCVVVVPGITDHTSLGPCGGGHPDISTKYPHGVDEMIAAVRAYRAHGASMPVLYTVTFWKLGQKARHVRTPHPGTAVSAAVRHGYTRISVVRIKRK